ncbi:MAG TPA: DegT/DnrJ/EryC1/StrS family aminotransferase [Gaiellaceae bacterium]|nr:DegT/DnrJ/EryC1/StrS family aminotransferase [Gaiellaceae bacterium]
MTVPYFAVDREFETIREPVLAAIEEVLRSGRMLGGPPIAELERELAARTGRRFAVATNSCTDALYFAFETLGIRPGDEVLVPDFSFAATASSVLRAGAVPVFVDVDDDYELDLDHAATLVSPRTRALVVVDLFGRVGDPSEAERFAAERDLVLVEDAAQTFGAVRAGRAAGSVGAASCFSFDPTKVVSAPGSGGALVTDDERVADRVRELRLHGKAKSGEFERLGYNAQMSSLAAAVLSVKLRYEEQWLRARQGTAGSYAAALGPLAAAAPEQPADREHVFHKYVVRVSDRDRDRVRAELERRGVTTLVHYPQTLSALPFVASGVHRGGGERATALTRSVLSLPINAHLRPDEVEQVTEALAASIPHA